MNAADSGLVAQVVPAIPSFSVDDGFSYAVPESLHVPVGSIVRVPVGNRRTRGYVTSIRDADDRELKPITSISGDYPAFDESTVEVLRWLALHYVAPMSVILAKTAPPNLPRRVRLPTLSEPAKTPASPHRRLSQAAADGARFPATAVLVPGAVSVPIAGLIAAPVQAGRSIMIIAPTVVEATGLAGSLAAWFGNRVLITHSGLDAKERTRVWVQARARGGQVLVGTREVMLWPVEDLGLAVVVEEERPAMKEPQTPTLHVREVLRKRAAVERFVLAFMGPAPSTDLLAAGVSAVPTSNRLWPLVEVIDRSQEPPEGRLISPRAAAALRSAFERDKRIFVFAHRRGYAPAFRCVRCRTVRRCRECDARLGREPKCERCGHVAEACSRCGGERFEPLGAGVERVAERVRRVLGLDSAASHPGRVAVGTEADLAGAEAVDLALVVDGDGLISAPHYRAAERALQIMVRVARLVERGRGNRLIVQTHHPSDAVIAALRHGDASEFMATQLEERSRLGLPPAGQVIVVETSEPIEGLEALAAERHADVFGPASAGHGYRWLIQGRDLRGFRVGLRPAVHEWRQAGIKVRVDADPRDL